MPAGTRPRVAEFEPRKSGSRVCSGHDNIILPHTDEEAKARGIEHVDLGTTVGKGRACTQSPGQRPAHHLCPQASKRREFLIKIPSAQSLLSHPLPHPGWKLALLLLSIQKNVLVPLCISWWLFLCCNHSGMQLVSMRGCKPHKDRTQGQFLLGTSQGRSTEAHVLRGSVSLHSSSAQVVSKSDHPDQSWLLGSATSTASRR